MLDHVARLPGVTAAEQVGVIEHVVEVVELDARLPASASGAADWYAW